MQSVTRASSASASALLETATLWKTSRNGNQLFHENINHQQLLPGLGMLQQGGIRKYNQRNRVEILTVQFCCYLKCLEGNYFHLEGVPNSAAAGDLQVQHDEHRNHSNCHTRRCHGTSDEEATEGHEGKKDTSHKDEPQRTGASKC